MPTADELITKALQDRVATVTPSTLRYSEMRQDPLTERTRRRRGWVMPAVAAAAVAAIAVPTAVFLTRGSSPNAPQTSRSTTPAARPPMDPRQAAIQTAKALLRKATVLPAAQQVAHRPLRALNHPGAGVAAINLVDRAKFWTAPGTVSGALAYWRKHPPADFTLSSSEYDGGPDRTPYHSLVFTPNDVSSRSSRQGVSPGSWLAYGVVAFHGGVAVRADALVSWTPSRSPADMVSSSVSSVDVVVGRTNAPTVRHTLTGEAAHQLAAAVNRLPRSVPIGQIPGCTGWDGSDTLVFHSSGTTVHVSVDVGGTCPTITFRAGHRPSIQLAGNLDQTVLTALGLPASYGRP